jgi:hypothetical protein
MWSALYKLLDEHWIEMTLMGKRYLQVLNAMPYFFIPQFLIPNNVLVVWSFEYKQPHFSILYSNRRQHKDLAGNTEKVLPSGEYLKKARGRNNARRF